MKPQLVKVDRNLDKLKKTLYKVMEKNFLKLLGRFHLGNNIWSELVIMANKGNIRHKRKP